ncbi:hypothetical protein B0T11DRAFT_284839 [Plectosphaerella cucumerina]|uniref:Uncharacterized protein n=1 Tax=Plectosphaerella cucumerina TaxID=40658 RepID=A0A8K0TDL7_9PEZI|nr:hypothetical protein B0T11DRAFT_284839 [Plectosphaerella cucumerina]
MAADETHPWRLLSEGTTEDALHADELALDAVGQRLRVEAGAGGTVELDPEVTKVALGLGVGELLDGDAGRERDGLAKTQSLLADDGDVPLISPTMVSSGHPWGDGGTYLEQIKRNIVLRTESIEVAPRSRKARKAVRQSLLAIHVEEIDEVVLLGHGETGAQHDCASEAAQQLRIEVHRIRLVDDGILQTHDQLEGALEDGVTLADGDALGAAPGHLLQGGDEALVRALGAFLGEGRLLLMVSTSPSPASKGVVRCYSRGTGRQHA